MIVQRPSCWDSLGSLHVENKEEPSVCVCVCVCVCGGGIGMERWFRVRDTGELSAEDTPRARMKIGAGQGWGGQCNRAASTMRQCKFYIHMEYKVDVIDA